MKILSLLFGLLFFGTSWVSKTEMELIVSKNIIPIHILQSKKKIVKQNIDSILSFNQQKIGEKQTYTGSKLLKNGKTKVNGIYIKKIADNEIEYSYTQLINWKKEFDRNGIAELTSTTDSIITRNSLKELAYKFIDTINGIVIYVTKNDRINITRAIVFNKSGQQISVLMYNK